MNISIWIKIFVIALIVVAFGLILYGRKTGLINDHKMKIIEKIVSIILIIIVIISFVIKLFTVELPSESSQLISRGIIVLAALLIVTRRATYKK
jgi:hypothetical protein